MAPPPPRLTIDTAETTLVECTSLTMTPSGRSIVAGFANGALYWYPTTVDVGDGSRTAVTADMPTTTDVKIDIGDTKESSSSSVQSSSSNSNSSRSSSSSTASTTAAAASLATTVQHGSDSSPTQRSNTYATPHTSITPSGRWVASILRAKGGWHTSLKLHVAAAAAMAPSVAVAVAVATPTEQDEEWCFAGAIRGSAELIALRIIQTSNGGGGSSGSVGQLSSTTSSASSSSFVSSPSTPTTNATTNTTTTVQVYRHSDAKLRGFGACIAMPHCASSYNSSPSFLLLTGKAIKNIHIWSFHPPPPSSSASSSSSKHQPFPPHQQEESPPPIWQCLYNCPTNGNTIQWMHFRFLPPSSYNATSSTPAVLQAISKSNGRKLRVWDLSRELTNHSPSTLPSTNNNRPTRPSFCDILHTESALGVVGHLVVCGGPLLFNQVSLVSLQNNHHLGDDKDDPHTTDTTTNFAYNHTELALPVPSNTSSSASALLTSHAKGSSSRRIQRGDIRSVESVTGWVMDDTDNDNGSSGSSVGLVLPLSDGTVALYAPTTTTTSASDNSSRITTLSSLDWLPAGHSQLIQLHSPPPSQSMLFATHGGPLILAYTYNPLTGAGNIRLQPILPAQEQPPTVEPPMSNDDRVPLCSKNASSTDDMDQSVNTVGGGIAQSFGRNWQTPHHHHRRLSLARSKVTPMLVDTSTRAPNKVTNASPATAAWTTTTPAAVAVVTTAKKSYKNSSAAAAAAVGFGSSSQKKLSPIARTHNSTSHWIDPTPRPSRPQVHRRKQFGVDATPTAKTPTTITIAAVDRFEDKLLHPSVPRTNKASTSVRIKTCRIDSVERGPTTKEKNRIQLRQPDQGKDVTTQEKNGQRCKSAVGIRFDSRNNNAKVWQETQGVRPVKPAKETENSNHVPIADRTSLDAKWKDNGEVDAKMNATQTSRHVNDPDRFDDDGASVVNKKRPSPLIPRKRSAPSIKSTPQDVVPVKSVKDERSTTDSEVATKKRRTFRISLSEHKEKTRQDHNSEDKCLNLPPPVEAKATITLTPKQSRFQSSELIRSACRAKIEELNVLNESIPRYNAWERRNERDRMCDVEPSRHAQNRHQLLMEHRAAHTQIRRRVIYATQCTIWSIFECPIPSSLDKAKAFLKDTLQAYKEQTNEILQRQTMEADALEALLSLETNGKDKHQVHVAFSFPLIFDEAMACLPTFY